MLMFLVENLLIERSEVHGADTITAISTPIGEGAIAIVRISGEESFAIANRIFPTERFDESRFPYDPLWEFDDPKTDEKVEEVMVSVMKAPRTFTREDIIEINCHGGMVSVNRVLQLILREGARLAEPGEFTKRAFRMVVLIYLKQKLSWI